MKNVSHSVRPARAVVFVACALVACALLAGALVTRVLAAHPHAAGASEPRLPTSSPSEAATLALSMSQEPDVDADAVLETIRRRRTVRAYGSDPVPEEDLVRILEAAHLAPTAGNQQPWKFLVIRDRQKLDLLRDEAVEWYMRRLGAQAAEPMEPEERERIRERVVAALVGPMSAPVYVAVLVDTEAPYPDYVRTDGTLAAGTLMIAARALGYGTGFFTSFFPETEMKQFFSIPDRYRLICFIPIGVPVSWPPTPEKKDLSELVVWESFATPAAR